LKLFGYPSRRRPRPIVLCCPASTMQAITVSLADALAIPAASIEPRRVETSGPREAERTRKLSAGSDEPVKLETSGSQAGWHVDRELPAKVDVQPRDSPRSDTSGRLGASPFGSPFGHSPAVRLPTEALRWGLNSNATVCGSVEGSPSGSLGPSSPPPALPPSVPLSLADAMPAAAPSLPPMLPLEVVERSLCCTPSADPQSAGFFPMPAGYGGAEFCFPEVPMMPYSTPEPYEAYEAMGENYQACLMEVLGSPFGAAIFEKMQPHFHMQQYAGNSLAPAYGADLQHNIQQNEQEQQEQCLSELPPGLPPPLGTPSRGSMLHGIGNCRPCAWFWKHGGCQNGVDCEYCHLCPAGEIKSRKKVKQTMMQLGLATPPTRNGEDLGFPSFLLEKPCARKLVFDGQQGPRSGLASSSDQELLQSHGDDQESTTGASSLGETTNSDEQYEGHTPGLTTGAPNAGSAFHGAGKCQPCAWFWKPVGCQKDAKCGFCHMCPEGERKDRKKSKTVMMRLGHATPQPEKNEIALGRQTLSLASLT